MPNPRQKSLHSLSALPHLQPSPSLQFPREVQTNLAHDHCHQIPDGLSSTTWLNLSKPQNTWPFNLFFLGWVFRAPWPSSLLSDQLPSQAPSFPLPTPLILMCSPKAILDLFAFKFVPDQKFSILSPRLHCDSGTINPYEEFWVCSFSHQKAKILVDSPRVLWPVNRKKKKIYIYIYIYTYKHTYIYIYIYMSCLRSFHLLSWLHPSFATSRPYIPHKPQSCMSNLDFCCCSVVQLCLTLCDLVDCSTPGFYVLCYLLELQFIFILMTLIFDSIYPKPNLLSSPETWILFPSKSSQAR